VLCADGFPAFSEWIRQYFVPTLVNIDSSNITMRFRVQAPMYGYIISQFLDTPQVRECDTVVFG
jgi:hypothetical protein